MELGDFYKVDPLTYYDRPDTVIIDLWNRTMALIERKARRNDD